MKQSIEKIPTWAFGYIFNGDMTGLTDEEVRMIDETLKSIGAELVCTPPDEEAQPYFSKHSIFRHDNFIGCFSADKIKMSARK